MKASFNRNKLVAAMAVMLGAAASTSALAVNLSDNGLGDVGIVSYYTVRDNNATNISVVNTSERYVAAFKIRFGEGDNTRDARDFNVFLSPNDVWTATVAMGENGVPYIQTADESCTAPYVVETGDFDSVEEARQAGFVVVGTTGDGRDIKQLDFTNIGYNGDGFLRADGGSASIERTTEGHIDIIGMGVAEPYDVDGRVVSELATLAVHGSSMNCGKIVDVYQGLAGVSSSGLCGNLPAGTPIGSDGSAAPTNEAFVEEYCEPLNVLKVSTNIIRVDKGVAGGVPVEMLANFFNPLGSEDPNAPDSQDLMKFPASVFPNLADAQPPLSVQITESGALTEVFDGAQGGANAVSSLFMATDVVNEYAIEGAANTQTAWVLSYPTKHFYVDTAFNGSNDPSPFENMFQNAPAGKSCVKVAYEYYDREEREPGVSPDEQPPLFPSPPPKPGEAIVPVNTVCEEVVTLNFGDEQLLGSSNNYFVPLNDNLLPGEPAFTSGWMRLGFPGAGNIVAVSGAEFWGLPVIGFSLKTQENGVVGTNTLNYGIVSDHAYLRDIR